MVSHQGVDQRRHEPSRVIANDSRHESPPCPAVWGFDSEVHNRYQRKDETLDRRQGAVWQLFRRFSVLTSQQVEDPIVIGFRRINCFQNAEVSVVEQIGVHLRYKIGPPKLVAAWKA